MPTLCKEVENIFEYHMKDAQKCTQSMQKGTTQNLLVSEISHEMSGAHGITPSLRPISVWYDKG